MAASKPPIGRGNTLFYALLVGAFLTWQSIHISYSTDNGLEVKTQQVPVQILTPCLVFMAVALGINLGDTLSKISEIVNRNSTAINSLNAKNIQDLIETAVEEEVQKALEERVDKDNDEQL